MAISVVHCLEPVEVHEDQGESRAAGLHGGATRIQRLREVPPVGEPGERIVERNVAQLVLGRGAQAVLDQVTRHTGTDDDQRHDGNAKRQGDKGSGVATLGYAGNGRDREGPHAKEVKGHDASDQRTGRGVTPWTIGPASRKVRGGSDAGNGHHD
jgi:hypothetical protein